VQPLPIDNLLPDIIRHLSDAGALVLKAEPGAGKTTRVPPAILDGGLAAMPDGKPGQIVLLQPRRLAARAAASRMSQERGTELGGIIGYRVRHESRASAGTRILACTEGVFLRRLQDDPLLDEVAVVIFDEFHERSINMDLALALSRQVRDQVRPDLRLVVMSATLDAAPIAAYLDNCPAIESPGQTYPVNISYLQFPSSAEPASLAIAGVKQTLPRTNGDVLVFLPGAGEIRQTQRELQTLAADNDTVVMPLYGEMLLQDQQEVLQPCSHRKLVLATNIAETSLTINGITAVVDTGFARVNRFDPNVGLNRLELSRISKASAAQRAGRAGRTAPGQCLRMWTEREHHMLAEFDTPEILRVDLSECLLQLLAFGETDVAGFPWYQRPQVTAIDSALELLEALGALDAGRLTQLGREMARLPLQPRISRLLIEGQRGGAPNLSALCAAVLTERPAFLRQTTRQQQQLHADSDVIERARVIDRFIREGQRSTIFGELSASAGRQIMRAAEQLLRIVQADAQLAIVAELDEPVEKAIMTAFPDRICKRRQRHDSRALMVGGKGVRLMDDSIVREPEWFVAAELIDLNQPELMVRQASAIQRDWLPAQKLRTEICVEYNAAKQRVTAVQRLLFVDLIVEETVVAVPPDVDASAVLAEGICKNLQPSAFIDDAATNLLARIACLRQWMPELNLPDFDGDTWRQIVSEWCCGCSAVADLHPDNLIHIILSRLTPAQRQALEHQAPEAVQLPNGRRVKLQYQSGKPPVLAARIQELFGMESAPKLAGGRVSLLVHLLAPNYRVQQITADLSSFWKNTYPEVRKELKGRYPKHKWPENPLAIP
jgi:ATP-dependent helicase HrpB